MMGRAYIRKLVLEARSVFRCSTRENCASTLVDIRTWIEFSMPRLTKLDIQISARAVRWDAEGQFVELMSALGRIRFSGDITGELESLGQDGRDTAKRYRRAFQEMLAQAAGRYVSMI